MLVIQGEGRAFAAGGDLQTIGAAAAADNIAPVVGELLKRGWLMVIRSQALETARTERESAEQPIETIPALWPLRSVNA